MNAFAKQASIVSALALMTVGSAGLANAQSKSYGDNNNYCAENPGKCGPEMNKSDAAMTSRAILKSVGFKVTTNSLAGMIPISPAG